MQHNTNMQISPPIAQQIPYTQTINFCNRMDEPHHANNIDNADKINCMDYPGKLQDTRSILDDYYWLRDPAWPIVKNPQILEYLNQENNYTKSILNNYQSLIDEIFNELKNQISDDQSYPINLGKYSYLSKEENNQEHKSYYRYINNKDDNNTKQQTHELILDANLLAASHNGFSLSAFSVSNNHQYLAYSVDLDGMERYAIYIKDLDSHQHIHNDQLITNTIGNIVWRLNDDGFYYVALDDNWKPQKVYFYHLASSTNHLIYQELDPTFTVDITQSADKKYLLINSSSKLTNELYYVDNTAIEHGTHQTYMLIPRGRNYCNNIQSDHLYRIDIAEGDIYIVTNDNGKNFRLLVVSINADITKAQELIPHLSNEYLVDINLYQHYIAITKRINGVNHVYALSRDNIAKNIQKHYKEIKFSDEIYELTVQFTSFDDEFIRLHYSSLSTPNSVYEYNPSTSQLFCRKTKYIPSYQSNNYQLHRLWVEHDNVTIPISIVFNKTKRDPIHGNPTLLYGYGSYGIPLHLGFRPNIIPLLDRGFIYAIAHIRGGDDLGFDWYETAKFLHKKRTFNDFIACAEFLLTPQMQSEEMQEIRYTAKNNLAIMGGSAGGMLIGNVINERPELFNVAIAMVPFVDVLNTMLDNTLPLTAGEFNEWGNPRNSTEYFDYIKSYSPYDNVKHQKYPAIFATGGLTDPRVTYWEMAKWVAKLRAYKLDHNPLILQMEMDAGHAGCNGRFKSIKETADIYGFIVGNFYYQNNQLDYLSHSITYT